MRSARIRGEAGQGYYHCMTRIIERRRVMGQEEKEKFRKTMRAVEKFAGVHVLTYTVLGNHTHLLVEVPERKDVNDEELIERLGYIYDKMQVKEIEQRLQKFREEKLEYAAETLKRRYTRRMYDVSEYMKTVKQRFTQWYNRKNGRRGTLWEERFKSILVEGQEHALATMAAYIDLNAVRAGIVKDPKDYRYCGYGEAVGGRREAREGLKTILTSLDAGGDWRVVGNRYREYLYVAGQAKGVDRDGRPVDPGFSPLEVKEALEKGGQLSRMQLMRCRVRYFSDGVVLGSKEFVEEVFRKHREEFGLKRKTGARKMRGGDWADLHTMRDLRLQVISVSSG